MDFPYLVRLPEEYEMKEEAPRERERKRETFKESKVRLLKKLKQKN